MRKLVDVLRKVDALEDKYRNQLKTLRELRQVLVRKAMTRETGKCSLMDLSWARDQADRRIYDKMLAELMVDTKDVEVEG